MYTTADELKIWYYIVFHYDNLSSIKYKKKYHLYQISGHNSNKNG